MEPIKKLIKQASVQIDRERETFANSLGITGVQMTAIDFLSNQTNNAANQKQFEAEFGIKRSTTTVMLQRMEKRDLIIRITDPNDQRKKQVQLTPKALALVKQIKEFMRQDDLELTSHLTADEIVTVKKVLNLVRKGSANA